MLLPETRLENLSDEFLERVSALISSKMVWLGDRRPDKDVLEAPNARHHPRPYATNMRGGVASGACCCWAAC